MYDDAQLKLYSQLLPKDFLHYGYFENPDIHPHDISINHLYKAQEDYGWQIVNQITDLQNPVLDIGCGMGGLIALLQTKIYKQLPLLPIKIRSGTLPESIETHPCLIVSLKICPPVIMKIISERLSLPNHYSICS